MSEEPVKSGFGSYIHNSFPETLHVNPLQSEVKPYSQLCQSSFSFQEYKRNIQNHEYGEEDRDQEDIQNPLNDHQEVEQVEGELVEELVEVDDNVEPIQVSTPVHNALNAFGNFIFDIYQSSAYYIPSSHTPVRNRFQYMNEYYRRMLQLIESSSKQEAASEETINKLCVNIYFSVDWCPICLEDYMENMVTTVLPCGHRFHLCCLKSWLQINHKCPVCKIVV